MTELKRVVIASGGTGGHFYPGLALANELRSRGGWEPLFLVKKGDISIAALQENYYPYAEIDMISLPRSFNPAAHLSFMWKAASSLAVCRRIIRDFKPVLVFGTGSYISFPAALAAYLTGVPAMIHESNAKFGLGNRLCARFVSKIALGLPIKDNPFSDRSELTGTPIRDAFSSHADPAEARARLNLKEGVPVVLVFGGSQGARRLNRAAAAAFKKLKEGGTAFQVLHVTGKRDYAETLRFYCELGLAGPPPEEFTHRREPQPVSPYGAPGLKILEYCEGMNSLYAAADLVCCRAGAGTITELLHLRKPSILVPLPSSAAGHQLENAGILTRAGAAVTVEEAHAFKERLARELGRLLAGPAALEKMRVAFSALKDLPDPMRAAANIAAAMENILAR